MRVTSQDFKRWLYFQLDRLQIPRRERRWIPLLLLLNLIGWSLKLHLDQPAWVDPALLEAEKARFIELFEKSYLEHSEIMSRYGVDLPVPVSDRPEPPGPVTLDLNTADALELQALPGIGPSYARRIVEWRNKNGPFTSLEQLLDVKGIGERRLDQLRPHLRLGAGTDPPSTREAASPPDPSDQDPS